MKKCIYCGREISHDSIIDFCEECGRKVFGDKMLKAIIENMSKAREKGDLYQGNISQNFEGMLDKDKSSSSLN